jgi:hypothetical protein
MDEFKAGDVVDLVDPETGECVGAPAFYLTVKEVLKEGLRLQSRQTALKDWDIVAKFNEVVKVEDD